MTSEKRTSGRQAARARDMEAVGSDAPIFIVGAPRSGTTLLQYMLRSHPNISLPTGESHFFIPFQRAAASFGDLSVRANMQRCLEEAWRRRGEFLETDFHGLRFDVEALADRLLREGRTTVAEVIRGLYEANAAGEGKGRWGEKTPYYILHTDLIRQMFPDAVFVHVIRDGRDVALSMLERRYDLGIHNIRDAAETWAKYVRAGLDAERHLGPGRWRTLKYESLLREPKATVSRLCGFLGEPFSEAVIDFRKAGETGKTPLLQKPLQQTNLEKWRTRMSAWQRAMFEHVAGDTMRAVGYEVDNRWRGAARLAEPGYLVHSKWLARSGRGGRRQ